MHTHTPEILSSAADSSLASSCRTCMQSKDQLPPTCVNTCVYHIFHSCNLPYALCANSLQAAAPSVLVSLYIHTYICKKAPTFIYTPHLMLSSQTAGKQLLRRSLFFGAN